MENMNDEDFIKNCDLVAKFIRVRKSRVYPNTVYGHISDLITVFGRSDLSSLTSSS